MRSEAALSVGIGQRWLWLTVAVVLQLVANGRWILPVAAWLAPLAWLVFLDRSPRRREATLAFALFVLTQLVVWRGIVPAPGLLYYLIAGTYAVVYFAPFAVHRAVAGGLSGIKGTLVFPAAWVGIEFLFHRWITPYGSWFSLAYTQTDFLPILQLASVTGVAGISFMMTWFAAVAAGSVRPGRPVTERARSATACGLVLLSVLAFGQLRLHGSPPGGELVRVAGVVPSPGLVSALEEALAPVRRGEQVSDADLATIESLASRVNDDLLARTVREARAGARLVAWSETAGRVMQAGEPSLLARAGRLAAEEGVDLVLAYGVWVPDGRPPFENKVAALSASGDIAWTYQKANPVVGAESPFTAAGDGVVRRLDTPYGGVGAVICHDLDFAPLLRQAGRGEMGLVVGPAADWVAITPLHAQMATLRSIESGFSLLRPTSSGRSIAVDTRGRTLAALDYADDVMVAHVPVASVPTLYAVVGDLFAWLCLATLIMLTGLAFFGRRPG